MAPSSGEVSPGSLPPSGVGGGEPLMESGNDVLPEILDRLDNLLVWCRPALHEENHLVHTSLCHFLECPPATIHRTDHGAASLDDVLRRRFLAQRPLSPLRRILVCPWRFAE